METGNAHNTPDNMAAEMGTEVVRHDTASQNQMSSERIKSALSDVANNSGQYGMEAYIVRKDKPRLRKMAFDEGTSSHSGFRSVLKDMLVEVIKDSYLADGVEYADGSLLADNQKKILFFEQGELFHPFLYIRDTDEYSDFCKEDMEQATGFLFCFRSGTKEVYLYQHLWSIMVPNKKRTSLMTRIITGEDKIIFSEQKEMLLTIAKKVDIVILDDYLITSNTTLLQNNFKFTSYITQSAKRVVQNISQTGLVANPEKLTSYISRGKTKYEKKMMRIGKSPVLGLSKERLIEKINTVERWKGKFQIDDAGEITLNTFGDVENVIDLFDERYVKSEITDTEYDTEVKNVAEPMA